MLGTGLTNQQKVDNIETRVILLTMFATLIPNAGPRVPQKGPGWGGLPENFRDVEYVRV